MPRVWVGDERTPALCRLVARRRQLVRQHMRTKPTLSLREPVSRYTPIGSARAGRVDLRLDLSTAEGKRRAQTFAFVAGWERRLVSERTRAAPARRRAQGGTLGTPRRAPEPVVSKIKTLRAHGLTLQAIAEELNRLRVPTAGGAASWRPSWVRSVLTRRS